MGCSDKPRGRRGGRSTPSMFSRSGSLPLLLMLTGALLMTSSHSEGITSKHGPTGQYLPMLYTPPVLGKYRDDAHRPHLHSGYGNHCSSSFTEVHPIYRWVPNQSSTLILDPPNTSPPPSSPKRPTFEIQIPQDDYNLLAWSLGCPVADDTKRTKPVMPRVLGFSPPRLCYALGHGWNPA